MYNTLKMKNKKGFTLVELLVVMAIISILTILSVANFRNVQIKARDAQRKSDLSQLQKALELYFNDHGTYPDSSVNGEVNTFGWKVPGTTSGGNFTDGNTVYLKEMVGDPSANPNYCYTSDGTYYVVYARLENINDPKIGSYTCNGESYNYEASSPNPEPESTP